MKTMIMDVEVDGELKPVEFYTTSAITYYLGWITGYIAILEKKGWFPITPYIFPKICGGREVTSRLYTKEQMDELRELVENHYPVLYRGRDPIIKAAYRSEMEKYALKVKELQDKWRKEDYLAKAERAVKPFKMKWSKHAGRNKAS